MKCEYKGDKIGIEGEVGNTACETCDNNATKVLRLITIPQSQCQAKLLFKHLCICQEKIIAKNHIQNMEIFIMKLTNQFIH